MNTLTVEKVVVDLKTGERKTFQAEVSNERDETHRTYSLTYEGYRTDWTEAV